MAIFLGLSGYAYKPWQGEGRFYPPELKAKEFFSFYANHFEAVEMDGTWYRMPSENAVQSWLAQAPDHFRYTFKAHRDITHMKRLKQPEAVDSIKFMVQRLEPLIKAGKLACLYFQFPPNFKRTDNRLEEFLKQLPVGPNYGMEFRHESWKTDEVREILQQYNITTVASDSEEWELIQQDTGNCIYARLRRETYSDDDLRKWGEWFQTANDAGKDVFVFFKHEDEGSPWIEAERLRNLMNWPVRTG